MRAKEEEEEEEEGDTRRGALRGPFRRGSMAQRKGARREAVLTASKVLL